MVRIMGLANGIKKPAITPKRSISIMKLVPQRGRKRFWGRTFSTVRGRSSS